MAYPVFPWIGGKRKLAKVIIPKIPPHKTYIEPFCGGAAIFFRKPKSESEILNDFSGEIINLYKVIQHHLDEFLRCTEWLLHSREYFNEAKNTPPETLTDIQRAVRFYYLQKCAFGGKVRGQSFAASTGRASKFNHQRIIKSLKDAHQRLSHAALENLHWLECCQKHDKEDTFFYLDPPYWKTEGYGIPFPLEEYQALKNFMQNCKGKALLSINPHPDILSLFECSGLHIESLDYSYSLNSAARKATKELLIRNYSC